MSVSLNFFSTVVGLTLGCAVIAHLLIRFLGWTVGGSAAAAAVYYLAFNNKGPAAKRLKALMKLDEFDGAPVGELTT